MTDDLFVDSLRQNARILNLSSQICRFYMSGMQSALCPVKYCSRIDNICHHASRFVASYVSVLSAVRRCQNVMVVTGYFVALHAICSFM